MDGLLGGFLLDLRGLDPLWPYLWLGQWVHTGKGTVRARRHRFILAAFADGLLRLENFSTSEAQGCRLKKDARHDFCRAYEQEAVGHRPVLGRIAEDFVAP